MMIKVMQEYRDSGRGLSSELDHNAQLCSTSRQTKHTKPGEGGRAKNTGGKHGQQKRDAVPGTEYGLHS